MKPPIKFGLIAAVLIIALYAGIYYTGNTFSPLWQFSRIIALGIMLPFIALTLLAKRKERGGFIGFRDSLKAGLQATLVITLLVAIFNYFFFKFELGAVYVDHAKELVVQNNMQGKEAEEMIKGMELYADPFTQAQSTFFWTLLSGTIMSLACATFIVRKPNEE